MLSDKKGTEHFNLVYHLNFPYGSTGSKRISSCSYFEWKLDRINIRQNIHVSES